ncbi:MAG: hypothetical protein AAF902_17785, partial [Chloroflexota bacterium]
MQKNMTKQHVGFSVFITIFFILLSFVYLSNSNWATAQENSSAQQSLSLTTPSPETNTVITRTPMPEPSDLHLPMVVNKPHLRHEE